MSSRNALSAAVLGVLVAGGVMAPGQADAARRSGGSFSGRGGFRSSPAPRAPMRAPSGPGGGTNIVVVPGGGYGYSPFGGYGYGYGGGLGFGTALVIGVGAVGALLAFRAMRMAKIRRHEALEGGGRHLGLLGGAAYDDDSDGGYADPALDRSYVYKVQLGLGRSARGLQERLEKFAAEGDTGTETGLAELLSQTSLELLREKDSIRYGQVEGAGPMTLQKGETKLNGLALAERSRFEVERVRGAEGKVRRSTAAPTTSGEVLEYLLVTVLVATRIPLPALTKLTDPTELDQVLNTLGGVSPEALLGLEVVWTPADPDDALTEKELLTTYPELRSL
jgi:uncharacterized membrane protein